MIQLSILPAANPEIPVKTMDTGASEAGFADLFAEQLGGAVAAGGKSLPVGLPEGGKSLPVDLPVAADAETQTSVEPSAQPSTQPLIQPSAQAGAIAVKMLAVGKLVIPAQSLVAADQEPALADAAGPDSEPPRLGVHPAVASKAVITELKAKGRSDRAAVNDAAKSPEHAEDGDAAKDETDTTEAPAESVNAISAPLPVIILAAPQMVAAPAQKLTATDEPAREGQHAAQARSDAPRGEQMRGDARLAAAIQIAGAGKPVDAGRTSLPAGDDAGQNAAPRTPRGGPEFRFELSKESGDARSDRAAGGQTNQIRTNQIRMPLAAASSPIVMPEPGSVHGHVADTTALSAAANPASTSFVSTQATRPHDFTALVDRLVEARETARGGSVNIAVMHADFGEVSLSFRHDAGGLSVSVANSDPEFARAVSAVTQTDGAQNGDNASAGQGRRDDSSQNGAFSRSGTGGNWGQSSADANTNGGGRQHMRGDSRPEQTARQSRMQADGERSGQDGIYA